MESSNLEYPTCANLCNMKFVTFSGSHFFHFGTVISPSYEKVLNYCRFQQVLSSFTNKSILEFINA